MKNSNKLKDQNRHQTTKTPGINFVLAIAVVPLLAISQIVNAQWSRTAPNVYLTTGTDKVGIGTTTPQTKLHINDQTPVSSFTGIKNSGLRIQSYNNPLNNYALVGFSGLSSAYSNRNLAQIGANFTGSGSSIFFGTSNSYAAGITNTAMTISPNGNVGIGTTAPTMKLDVNGDAFINKVRVGTGNGGVLSNTIAGKGGLNSNTTGFENTAIGYQTLFLNTGGGRNTAIGYKALDSNTIGDQNTAVGAYSLIGNTGGTNNTATGYAALLSNTSGSYNSATGWWALGYNKTGLYNTATGNTALLYNTMGGENTAFGWGALQANTTGSNNTAIGFAANVLSEDLENATAIGAGALVSADNRMQLGSSTAIITTSGGYTVVSDGRFKDEVKTDAPGLLFINKLHPVTYNFNYKRYDGFLRKDRKDQGHATDKYKQQLVERGKQREIGFIAQEVDQICRDNKFTFNGVYSPQNDNDNYALDYSRFVVPLVKAVQELSTENDKLKEEINQLKATVYANKNMNNGTASIMINASTEVPLLGQNIPNPAANNTIIPFRIPKNCNSASIVISESGSGKIVNAIPVSCNETHLAIDAGTLARGSYTYSLYINGKLGDSKQMILAK